MLSNTRVAINLIATHLNVSHSREWVTNANGWVSAGSTGPRCNSRIRLATGPTARTVSLRTPQCVAQRGYRAMTRLRKLALASNDWPGEKVSRYAKCAGNAIFSE